MEFIGGLIAKWHRRRMFCWYCGDVPVSNPRACCSDECADLADLHSRV